jgi:DNA modification methylase
MGQVAKKHAIGISNTDLSSEVAINQYLNSKSICPLFICAEAREILTQVPDETFDFCMTSPPYWGKREYSNGGIGLEQDYDDYINNLCQLFDQVRRVLKKTGSFWLNIGDSYLNKTLLGIPWRVAIKLVDEQGWHLRNSVIWNKIKGSPDNSLDKLRNVHENIFHFVKDPKDYYYDLDSIRSNPRKTKVVNGSVVSATGVSGIRYKRQIELSSCLSDTEKKNAINELNHMLENIVSGVISDFRMIIRGQQRTTHSNSQKVSGRARELEEKGFYFLKYHPNGSKPSDVWDILPEDTQNRKSHYAPYPEDLCKIPLLATCPRDGVVLDPFCGTGTTMYAAFNLSIKSIGIDISADYVKHAKERCNFLL